MSKKKVLGLVLVLVFMIRIISVQAEIATEGNDYPIVLVHGLAGWGPDEGLGLL